jgi:hypothetical protein
MAKFNVGDHVRVKPGKDSGRDLVVGRIYTVKRFGRDEVYTRDPTEYVYLDTGSTTTSPGGWDPSRFELVFLPQDHIEVQTAVSPEAIDEEVRTIFDRYLEEQMRDAEFASSFETAFAASRAARLGAVGDTWVNVDNGAVVVFDGVAFSPAASTYGICAACDRMRLESELREHSAHPGSLICKDSCSGK